jgi:hypothetical protein
MWICQKFSCGVGYREEKWHMKKLMIYFNPEVKTIDYDSLAMAAAIQFSRPTSYEVNSRLIEIRKLESDEKVAQVKAWLKKLPSSRSITKVEVIEQAY